MSLQQINSTAHWIEPENSGVTSRLFPAQLIDDGLGGYTIEIVHGDPGARLLADAYGGFTVHDGPANSIPSAELFFLDAGNTGAISTYE